MKKVEAIIRPEKVDQVRRVLEEVGFPGLMLTEVEGHGKQKGVIQQWRGEQYRVEILDAASQVGSGSLPTETIASAAIGIRSANSGEDISRSLAAAFRKLPTPVIGHVHKGRLLLDLRCLDDEAGFVSQLESLRT